MKTNVLWMGLGLLLLVLATCHCSTFGVASDQEFESDSHHFDIRGRDYSGEEDDDTVYHYNNRGGQRGGDDDEEDERRGGKGRDDDDDKKKKPCHKKDDKKKPCHDDAEPEEVDWDDSDYADFKFEFEPETCQSLEDVRLDFAEPVCKPKDDGKCIEITKRKCFKLFWGKFKPIPCPPKKKDNHHRGGKGRYD